MKSPTHLKITALIYLELLLCLVGLLPWPLVTFTLGLVFSRWAFSIHTTIHQRGESWLSEQMFLMLSPLSVGLNSQRTVHLRHHDYLGEAQDPDWFYYSPVWPLALLRCCLHPEVTYIRSLPGFRLRHYRDWSVRLVLFVSLVGAGGLPFLLWYFLPLRLLFAGAQFVFTYGLHHNEQERTIDLVVPQLLQGLVGPVGVQALEQHTKHHGVKAHNLGALMNQTLTKDERDWSTDLRKSLSENPAKFKLGDLVLLNLPAHWESELPEDNRTRKLKGIVMGVIYSSYVVEGATEYDADYEGVTWEYKITPLAYGGVEATEFMFGKLEDELVYERQLTLVESFQAVNQTSNKQ